MRKPILLLLGLLSSSFLFCKQTTKEAVSRELMNLIASVKLGAQFAGMLMKDMKDLRPEVPDVYWDYFLEVFNPDSITAIFIPGYAK